MVLLFWESIWYNVFTMKYIKRKIEDEIIRLLHKGKVIVVYGPRQSGKTTMLQHINKSQNFDALWLDADSLDVRERISAMTPEKWKTILNGKKTLVIDEAQRVDGIGLALKILIDNIKDLQVIVTGSSAFDLRNKTEESLTGRKFEFLLLPLSFEEMSAIESPLEEL